MKYYFSFLVFCAFSCSKVENIAPPPCIEKEEIQDSTSRVIGNPFFPNPHGEAYCTKVNQLTWFEPIIQKDFNDSNFLYIFLFGRNIDSALNEELVIWDIPFKIGCYKISDYQSDKNRSTLNSDFTHIDGDINIDAFILDTTEINKISISSIDTTSKTITGYFAVSFVFKNDRPKRNPFYPYRMRFFNGYFKGKYE
ncbi:MAG: hypothetical protein IPQ10_03745 [Saprospiraceae bacterium]|jgi:hypothetical protein|nr:hypothetical protein [Saprospiraceae bacterium]MBK7796427.1 hypothetical protein [Saprospiraceae bacterium]MBL0260182.1 hypothetical protein [Saprospiraceae bacterium]